jgi:hypothetical protein
MDQRLEEFFTRAIPIGTATLPGAVVMWVAFRGAIIRIGITNTGEFLTDLVEPDTSDMDDLLAAAGADAVMDGVKVSTACVDNL